MKKTQLILALVLFLTKVDGQAVIFETDNRIEAQSQTTPFWRERAKSVVALIPNDFIRKKVNGHYELKGDELQKGGLRFCPSAQFANQKLIANCTGSLISEQHVLTAAHCLDKDSSQNRGCQDYKIAFDYATGPNGVAPQTLKSSDVFKCKKIVYRRFDTKNFTEDLAVIELDRKVTKRQPVQLKFEAPEVGTPLAMIGHPLGIPQKFTDNAEVLKSQPEKVSFHHNLETFSVNSGGPIFDALSGEQVGVLVRGTGANRSLKSQHSCYDWSVGHSKDFAEGNDLTPLKDIFNSLK